MAWRRAHHQLRARVSDHRSPDRYRPADYRSFVAGLYDSWVIAESIGLSYCMQVNFTPFGARRFFRVPMDEIANRAVHGNRPIGALAKELGWSPKRLITGFRQEIGLPPRALARIIRFHRVVRWLDGRDEVRWAELAHRAGYFDQAHFNRDFRELAGSTPGEFFRRRVAGGGNMEA